MSQISQASERQSRMQITAVGIIFSALIGLLIAIPFGAILFWHSGLCRDSSLLTKGMAMREVILACGKPSHINQTGFIPFDGQWVYRHSFFSFRVDYLYFKAGKLDDLQLEKTLP